MKPIKWTKRFRANYNLRIANDDKLEQAFDESVDSFLYDRTAVDDHQLEGKMGLIRAFSVTNDYRVAYIETPNYFLFVDVGRHKEVYYC